MRLRLLLNGGAELWPNTDRQRLTPTCRLGWHTTSVGTEPARGSKDHSNMPRRVRPRACPRASPDTRGWDRRPANPVGAGRARAASLLLHRPTRVPETAWLSHFGV